MYVAPNATAIITIPIVAKVAGSLAVTPNSSRAITRRAANDTASPAAMPAIDHASPLFTTSVTTSSRVAPRARRMPISLVRCATE